MAIDRELKRKATLAIRNFIVDSGSVSAQENLDRAPGELLRQPGPQEHDFEGTQGQPWPIRQIGWPGPPILFPILHYRGTAFGPVSPRRRSPIDGVGLMRGPGRRPRST